MVYHAIAQLVVAALFWGFGFIAVVWAFAELNAYEITFSRFAIGALVGLLLQFNVRNSKEWKIALKLSFVAAFFLSCTLVFQTLGLQYTTAAKSGFITTLYVVVVPILEAVYRRRALGWQIWAVVLIALVGTALMMRLQFSSLNKGDLLTLVCMIFASFHIMWMGHVSHRTQYPFLFNTLQSFWAAILVWPFIQSQTLYMKWLNFPNWGGQAIIGILALALGSTTLAFYLQVRAQAHLSATVSSLLFLLESPFALIFAILLLGESLTPMEATGAVLIFVAAVLASFKASHPAPHKNISMS